MFLFKEVKYKDILNIDNLHIKKHKVTSIIGESGSGKTTILRLLNKLVSCESGEIFYNNESLNTIDSVELRRNVVMLPQSPAIYNGSIKDNLLIGLKFSEKKIVSDDKLNEILQLVKLHKELDLNAEKLSGGEKQRLALARVILMEPEVLLLDEPSSALDKETESIIIESIANFTKNNCKTLIMVTHSNKIANKFSNEIIEIKEGTVVNHREVLT